MKLRHRIWVIIAVAVLGTIAVSSFGLYSLRQTMMNERQAQISTLLGYGRGVLEYYQGQEASGKLTREEAQAKAKDAFSALRNGSDYFFVRNTENMLLVHPDPKRVGIIDKGTKLPDGRFTSEAYAEILAKADQGSIPILTARPGDPNKQQVEKLNGVLIFHPWQWIVGTGFFIDDMEKIFWERAIGFMLIGGTLAIVVTGAALILSRGILRQLGGEPVEAANIMEKVAQGDLGQHAASAPGNSLLGSLGSMVVALRALLGEINGNANQLARHAEQIKSAAQQINGAAENQSDATSSMAAAIEELAVSSSHICERARDTEKDSREAIVLASEGRQRAGEASDAIQSVASAVSGASARIHALEERASQISSIASVIKDIAGQTNLLALNAAIEAARAGEQGRGFAVVADEVRKLAERTSLATAEIEQMVTGIQGDTIASVNAMNAVLPKVQQGVQLANAASDSLHGIESGANRMLENICEVANATSEQSAASTSIAQRVEEISQMVEETTASIRETANTASELDSIAQGLKAQISRFKV